MPITYKKKVAVLNAHCEIEEAEALFNWLAEAPSRQVNLKSLESAHTAVYQVLIGLKPKVSVWPVSEHLFWLSKNLINDEAKVWFK
jgi:hypothetical protein